MSSLSCPFAPSVKRSPISPVSPQELGSTYAVSKRVSNCCFTASAVAFAVSFCAWMSPESCVATNSVPFRWKLTFPTGGSLPVPMIPLPRVNRKIATITTTAITTPAMIRFRATFDRSGVLEVRPEAEGAASRSGVLSSVAKARRGYQASGGFLCIRALRVRDVTGDASVIRCGVRCTGHAGEPGRLVGTEIAMTGIDPSPLRLPWSRSDRAFPRTVVRPLQEFLRSSTASALPLFCAAVVALAWANSPWWRTYERLWATTLTVGVGRWAINEDLRFWVGEGLMTFFFLLAGLEIKRELVTGELRDRRAAIMPVAAAVGGMVVPAAIYLVATSGTPAADGGGMAMPTDLAFALAIVV